MKFGVREICDVVLKAKAAQKVGNKIFYKNEPVCYFDTLKTSSLEGAATTVYAQGGRGNSRLVAWEGERTITFTMEDALISPAGFMILSGAGLTEAAETKKLYVHTTEQTDRVIVRNGSAEIILEEKPYTEGEGDLIYIMVMHDGEIVTEPYIPDASVKPSAVKQNAAGAWEDVDEAEAEGYKIVLKSTDDIEGVFTTGCVVLADYYVERNSDVQ